MILGIGAGVGFGQSVPKTQSKIIILDSFDRADADTLGNTETGQTWVNGNKFGIRNGQAVTLQLYSTARLDTLVTDFKLSVDIINNIYARLHIKTTADESNNLRLQFSTNGNVQLYQSVEGSIVSLGYISSVPQNSKFEIICKGNILDIYINGEHKIKGVSFDPSLVQLTEVGISGWNTSDATFDNLKVEGL